MRYAAALFVSFVLIVAMLFFASYMGRLVQEWDDEDIVLTHGQLLLMDVGVLRHVVLVRPRDPNRRSLCHHRGGSSAA